MLFHYIFYYFCIIRFLRKYEVFRCYIISESDNIYPFSILWNTEVFTVENFIEHLVSQILQNRFYNIKCTTSIMVNQILHIFTEYNFRFMVFYNPCDIKKKSSSCIFKAPLLPCKRKGLTRKPCK